MKQPLLVAEVSSNHHRDLRRSLAFVDAAAAVGAGAVKFQQFRIDRLFAPEALRAHPQLGERRAWELPESFNRELALHARARGVAFASTPFYLRAVEVLEPWVDFFKVASYQVLWLDLLREVGRTHKPVVLATGMATLDEVRRALDALRAAGAREVTLLHCVSLYPTPPEEANLRAIETLRRCCGGPVGWSDHTVDREVVARAVERYGASMVEFHFDLDGRGEEFASGHCWLPRDVLRLRERLRRPDPGAPEAHPSDGDGRKEPRPAEAHERAWRTDPADGLRPLLATRAALRDAVREAGEERAA